MAHLDARLDRLVSHGQNLDRDVLPGCTKMIHFLPIIGDHNKQLGSLSHNLFLGKASTATCGIKLGCRSTKKEATILTNLEYRN